MYVSVGCYMREWCQGSDSKMGIRQWSNVRLVIDVWQYWCVTLTLAVSGRPMCLQCDVWGKVVYGQAG